MKSSLVVTIQQDYTVTCTPRHILQGKAAKPTRFTHLQILLWFCSFDLIKEQQMETPACTHLLGQNKKYIYGQIIDIHDALQSKRNGKAAQTYSVKNTERALNNVIYLILGMQKALNAVRVYIADLIGLLTDSLDYHHVSTLVDAVDRTLKLDSVSQLSGHAVTDLTRPS